MGTRQPRRHAATILQDRLAGTLIELALLPSVSGQEGAVRDYLAARLTRLRPEADGPPLTDTAGNLIARVRAFPDARNAEPPLLLNAHMDRVPPGRAHTPTLAGGILRSDGTTNLGADDSAGLAVILHTVETLRQRGLSHPPLLLLFTVGEEVGLVGARAFDPRPWGTREGIVFDNAGEAGVAVTRAASYIAFDVTLRGRGGHPGKRLEGTASAIEMFRRARYPAGALDGDTTRVSIGRLEAGTARNAVPDELRLLGEARTLLAGAKRTALLRRIERAFSDAASALGGSAAVTFDPHGEGYEVDGGEPLLRAYAAACAARGQPLRTMTTFIGSDASPLRAHSRVFTVSTGVMEEHTTAEWIALAPLAELTETAISLLGTYRAGP